MAGMLRVPRSRGVLSGVLLVLLGLWGGLIPFVGPYVDFAYSPNSTWVWTADRFWLNVLPAIAVGLGGLIVLASANRAVAVFGAWMAALGGGWFIVGPTVSALWKAAGTNATGSPIGAEARQVAEQLAFFTGIGALAVFFAALALGRFTVVGIREARYGDREAAEAAPVAGAETSATQPMRRPAAPGDGAAEADTGQAARGRYSRPPEPGDQRVAGSPRSGRGGGEPG
ncbi:MAG TPA: hypothetical protein VFU43_21540 [Streptosporangiaceae bacterium]|nr:hypothetical protein [Streptosporangiaceae bacterium]